jgi:membrane protein
MWPFTKSKSKQTTSDWLVQHVPLWGRIVAWSQTHSLPGCRPVPVYRLVTFIQNELARQDVTTRANAIAYSIFLGLFPGLIVLFTLIAYLPIYQNLSEWIQINIAEFLPGMAGKMLLSNIQDLMTTQRGGLLSFSFFLTIYFSSNAMMALMRGFEKTHKISFRRRHVVLKRLIAVEMTFLLVLVLVGSFVLIILGNQLITLVTRWLSLGFATAWLISVLRWLVVVVIFHFSITILYRLGSTARRPIPFFAIGTLLATIISLLSSFIFSFYVDNFGNYNTVYGSIGAVIVMMLWLQLNATILLLGFEINAAVMINRAMIEQEQDAASQSADVHTALD